MTKSLKTGLLGVFGIGILLLNTGCFMYSTGPTEVGVRTRKVGFIAEKGVDNKIYQPGYTYFFLPLINDWHTFDTRLFNIEMTLTENAGDVFGPDDLKFKTIDGNDISLDVIVSYRIQPDQAPKILQYVAKNDDDLRLKIVRTIARSRPRDIFGELETESFYNAALRAEKAERAKTLLNNILGPYGVTVERVLTKDYRFNAAYQKAIEDKKIADQKTEQNKSAIKAKTEEYKRKLEEIKGQVNQLIAKADGDYIQATIKADAYYAKQGQIAKAIEAEGVAEARGITALNRALAEAGGEVMVKLKVAEALKGKRIVLLPTGGGEGLSLKTLDVNSLIDVYGLKGLSKQTPPTQPAAALQTSGQPYPSYRH